MVKEIFREIKARIEKKQPSVIKYSISNEGYGTMEDMKKHIVEEKINKPEFIKMDGYNLFLEPYFPKERMIILGGGHIALPLTEFATRVGFMVTVIDDRPSFANSYRFPTASEVRCESFQSCLQSLHITSQDYVVIITRGHRHDLDSLKQLMELEEPAYVGMIGSKRRVAVVREQLISEGYSKDRLDRVCSPIGLSIGAVTPEEISVSIMAQIIKRKRLDGSMQNSRRSDFNYELLEILTKEENQPFSIVTILSSVGSVPRNAGAKMIVYKTGQITGSIGGGCSEDSVIHEARKIIGTKMYKVITIDMTGEEAEEEGMVCGGTMTVLIEDGC